MVCFDGVLPRKYVVHFAMLSKAYYLLLQNSVSLANLDEAHRLLRQFVFLYQDYFGKTAMVYNIHQLLHVTKGVKDWGPLWGPNTFLFEGENFVLSQMNTSSGHVGIQLTRRYLTLSYFPDFVKQYVSTDTALDFVQEIMDKNYTNYVLCDRCVLAGKGVPEVMNDQQMLFLQQAGIMCDRNVLSFRRCIYDRKLLSTKEYAEGKLKDDSWIKTNSDKRGYIQKILQVNVEGRSMVVFIMKEMNVSGEPFLRDTLVNITHLKRVQGKKVSLALKPEAITDQCIYFKLHTGTFICDIPYGCYGD